MTNLDFIDSDKLETELKKRREGNVFVLGDWYSENIRIEKFSYGYHLKVRAKFCWLPVRASLTVSECDMIKLSEFLNRTILKAN